MNFYRRVPSMLYSWTVIMLAYGLVVYLYPMLDLDLTRQMVFMLVLAVAAECFSVTFPRGRFSAVFAVILASFLMFGTAGAVWVTAPGCLLGQAIANRASSLRTLFFNTSQYVLAVAAGGFVYGYLGGDPSLRLAWANILPLAGFGVACFIVNQVLVYLYLLPGRGNYPFLYWRDMLRWDGLNYLLVIPPGVLMAVLYIKTGLWGVFMLFVPVPVVQAVLRLYIDNELSNRQLRALYEVSTRLGGEPDLDEVLETALAEAGRIVRYYTGIIYLWSEEKGCYEAAAVRGGYAEQFARSRVIPGEDFLGCLARDGEETLVYDSRRDPAARGDEGFARVHRSLLVIPLLAGNETLGLLVLGDRRVFTFQQSHRDIFHALACQLAAAVSSARLNSKVDIVKDTDGVTGLYTRSFFFEHAREVLAESGSTVSLVVADIDRLWKVNYEYGYEAGDAVLSFAARTVRSAAGSSAVTARLGGGEFAVLLPGTGEVMAARVAEEIRQGIQNSAVEFRGQRCSARASLGIACYPRDAENAGELLRRGEEALTRAKENGGNCAVIYSQMDREEPVALLKRQKRYRDRVK